MVTKISMGRGNLSVSDTEMMVDPIISYPANVRYVKIPVSGGKFVRTAHLNNNRPAGGNVLFLDGHIQWRNYNVMTNKITPSGLPQFEF
jgi:prepilin-type processing-associated H-X9-DG protein